MAFTQQAPRPCCSGAVGTRRWLHARPLDAGTENPGGILTQTTGPCGLGCAAEPGRCAAPPGLCTGLQSRPTSVDSQALHQQISRGVISAAGSSDAWHPTVWAGLRFYQETVLFIRRPGGQALPASTQGRAVFSGFTLVQTEGLHGSRFAALCPPATPDFLRSASPANRPLSDRDTDHPLAKLLQAEELRWIEPDLEDAATFARQAKLAPDKWAGVNQPLTSGPYLVRLGPAPANHWDRHRSRAPPRLYRRRHRRLAILARRREEYHRRSTCFPSVAIFARATGGSTLPFPRCLV